MNRIKMVIFDWNGTLIDDVWLGVNATNAMLEKKKMKPITTEFYKEHFIFPVINYYKSIGLDVENEWEEITKEFNMLYFADIEKVKLFRDAEPTLKKLKKEGLKLGIFSAMEHTSLNKHVQFLRIADYFDFIEGIEDYYAGGKVHLGKKILEKTALKPEEILFVGDAYHDFETAREIGCDIVLVSRGHNAVEKLNATGAPVLNSIAEIVSYLNL